MKNITKILLFVGILLASVSCDKFFDDMKPTDNVSDMVIWETTANAEYNVNYLYDYVYVVVTDQSYNGVMTEAYADMLKYSSFNPGHPGLFVSQMAYGDPYAERNFVNVYMVMKYIILIPMLLCVVVVDYKIQIIPNRLNLLMFNIGLIFYK